MNSARWIHPDYDLAEQWQDEHEREEAAPVPPLSADPFPGYLGATNLRAITEWNTRQARREAEYAPPRPLDEPSPPPVGTLRRRGRSQQPASSAP